MEPIIPPPYSYAAYSPTANRTVKYRFRAYSRSGRDMTAELTGDPAIAYIETSDFPNPDSTVAEAVPLMNLCVASGGVLATINDLAKLMSDIAYTVGELVTSDGGPASVILLPVVSTISNAKTSDTDFGLSDGWPFKMPAGFLLDVTSGLGQIAAPGFLVVGDAPPAIASAFAGLQPSFSVAQQTWASEAVSLGASSSVSFNFDVPAGQSHDIAFRVAPAGADPSLTFTYYKFHGAFLGNTAIATRLYSAAASTTLTTGEVLSLGAGSYRCTITNGTRAITSITRYSTRAE